MRGGQSLQMRGGQNLQNMVADNTNTVWDIRLRNTPFDLSHWLLLSDPSATRYLFALAKCRATKLCNIWWSISRTPFEISGCALHNSIYLFEFYLVYPSAARYLFALDKCGAVKVCRCVAYKICKIWWPIIRTPFKISGCAIHRSIYLIDFYLPTQARLDTSSR